MSKGKGGKRGGGFGGGGGMPNMNNMMKQMQQMQADMAKAQEELEHETVEVSVGGGIVTIVMTGHQRTQSVTIDKTKIDFDDEEWVNDLQDLLTLAVNQAVEQSQTMAAQRMEDITGGLGSVPGLGDLLGGGF